MQYEAVCTRICNDITQLFLELTPQTSAAAYAAAAATRDIAAAFHHASGRPQDARWEIALTSLEFFLDYCNASAKLHGSLTFLELRNFLEENADLYGPRLDHALAS